MAGLISASRPSLYVSQGSTIPEPTTASPSKGAVQPVWIQASIIKVYTYKLALLTSNKHVFCLGDRLHLSSSIVHTLTRTHVHAHAHARTHTRMHTRTHACTHAHTLQIGLSKSCAPTCLSLSTSKGLLLSLAMKY